MDGMDALGLQVAVLSFSIVVMAPLAVGLWEWWRHRRK